MRPPILLETERLHLRPLEPGDAQALHSVLGDAETMSFYPEPWSLEIVQRLIEHQSGLYQSNGIGWFAVLLRDAGELIGDCGISHQNIDGVAEFEIGYHIHRDHWGKGYATEAAREIKRYGFEDLYLKKLCSYMAADHLASRRVAENNGMTLEKTYNNPRNRDLPTTVYSIEK
ncbi:MAG: GNAT family N-acetyltransferase [Verrucomicrobiales bacterium]|nr:GNAT family N-acetyltransferase [Verrucomicrobiales bacterium]